jgi:hypothetical protein
MAKGVENKGRGRLRSGWGDGALSFLFFGSFLANIHALIDNGDCA